MRIHAIKDVSHALTGRFTRGPETFVIIKVEDAFKGRTRASRTDRWTEELHNIEIDKANEIELTVYDKSGQNPMPIGMLWIRIADLAEELRRKKIETELSGSQWMTADQMSKTPGSVGPSGYGGPPTTFPTNPPPRANNPYPQQGQQHPDENDPNVIDAWFALEPVGAIRLTMSFGEYCHLISDQVI